MRILERMLRGKANDADRSAAQESTAPGEAGPAAEGEAPVAPVPGVPTVGGDAWFVYASYWLILGRAPDDHGRESQLRLLTLGQPRSAILLALVGSVEFRVRRDEFMADPSSHPAGLDAALSGLGDDPGFVGACYEMLLGRSADEAGLASYVGHLGTGHSRISVVRALLASDEFVGRYAELCPSGGIIPVDTQLCELANPAKWDNPEWLSVLRELGLPADTKLAMHRKAYEFTQTIWGMRRLGFLRDDVSVLSVGAGHEPILYWLANNVGGVVATDLYDGAWRSTGAAEGDRRVLTHPWEFSPFPYRRERLRFLPMNGTALGLAADTFDVAYSLSSVEHFGGWAGSRRSVEEMARVLKLGGLLVLATEWIVRGPSREEVFLPDEFRSLIDVASLELVEPLDDRVWARYAGSAIDLRRNPFETPHMLVKIDETVFTSVFVFLRKR